VTLIEIGMGGRGCGADAGISAVARAIRNRESREPSAPRAHGKRMNSSLSYFLSILWFVLWIVAIVDCARSSNPNKVVWIIVIILLPFLGSILYFLFARRTA
jgi:hypothetical protein